MMKQMMELAKLNENHKLLADLAGSWSTSVKMMEPGKEPTVSKGSVTYKSIMNGRYFVGDHTGSMKMPGADGKMKDFTFKGMSTDGYDNVKQKFVSSWVDNMGTGILTFEGTYRPRDENGYLHRRNGDAAWDEDSCPLCSQDDGQEPSYLRMVQEPWWPGNENFGD